jgi:hypothetical protein
MRAKQQIQLCFSSFKTMQHFLSIQLKTLRGSPFLVWAKVHLKDAYKE